MEEIWKDIPGYESCYQASNTGRIRSKKRYVYRGYSKNGLEIFQRVDERILSLHSLPNGYLSIMLHQDGKTKRMLVHRIVAMLFVSNPDKKPDVNHIDGNRANNIYTNLEWCTQRENVLHASRTLHTLTYHGKPVRCVETGETFPSIRKAAEKYGVADTNLCNAIKGKRQTRCAGYHWEHINNNQS